MIGRLWGVRHIHWLYLACRWEWWWQRTGKYRPNVPTALIDKYLYEVWEGRPHA